MARRATVPVVDHPEELMERIAAEIHSAFEDLDEQHRGPRPGYLRLLTAEHGPAEELQQHPSFAVRNGVDRFAGESSGRVRRFEIAGDELAM